MILFTPLLKYDEIFEALLACKNPAMMVIGEKDTHYIPGKIMQVANNANVQIEEVPAANHSLDIEPFTTGKFINVLGEIMEKIKSFLS